MRLKWWMLVLFGVGCLLMGSIIGVVIPQLLNPPPITPTITELKPDIPRYTGDEVIALVQPYRPDFASITSWSAIYQGGGQWLVKRTINLSFPQDVTLIELLYGERSRALERFGWHPDGKVVEYFHFHEDSGRLHRLGR